MGSPILIKLFGRIRINPALGRPIYLQLSDQLLTLIKQGNLRSGQKLPSSRETASLLNLNRVTVSKAYEELQLQGWLERFVGRGSYVSPHLPEVNPLQGKALGNAKEIAGFTIGTEQYPENLSIVPRTTFHLDDGFPDPKLAPLKELYRAYRSQLTRSGLYHKFGSYGLPDGPGLYKDALSRYLNETRGMNTSKHNLMSVRGTSMGLNLVCAGLLSPGDIVVSGIPGWRNAEYNFRQAKAKHVGIPVDEHGIVVDELKKICRKRKVRLVYVTPHHHYPTGVSLRIDRRLELLRLANENGFIIFEDDYDFDFHYNQSPLLPIASADDNGMVVYCGSFSKCFSPAFRMGYLAASENVIKHLAHTRLLIDRQGDHVLDSAMAELLNEGTLQRFVRKAVTVYNERRNHCCNLLQSELNGLVKCSVPEGGMSVWAKFNRNINLDKTAKRALAKDLYLSNGQSHKYPAYDENAIRIGFASSSPEEMSASIAILKSVI